METSGSSGPTLILRNLELAIGIGCALGKGQTLSQMLQYPLCLLLSLAYLPEHGSFEC